MSGYIGFPNADKNLTNLINGTISTSNWTTNNTNTSLSLISTTTESYLCLKANSSSTATTRYASQNLATTITQNNINIVKVYFQAKVRGDTSNNRSTPQILRLYSSSTESIANTDWEGNSGTQLNTDTWHTMSGIIDNSSKEIKGIGFQITSSYQNDKIYFKDIIVVNLTDTFGNGKEPIKQQCDENIFLENEEIFYQGTQDGRAQKILNLYVGIGGVAKKVTKGYIGVNGVAKKWYQGSISFKEFFESIDSFDTWGQYASSTAIYPPSTSSTYPAPSASLVQPAPGQVWYLFYTVGSSLEISKVSLLTTTTLSLNRIRTIPINTQYLTAVNSSQTGISGTQSTWGSFSLYLHSTLSNSLIEDKLLNGTINILKGYHSANESSNAESSIIISNQNVPTEGLIMPIFTDQKSTKTNIWGVVDLNNGITSNVIKGGKYTESGGAVWNTDGAFLYNTTYSYYYPCNSNNYIKTHGYTLLQFID